MKFLIRMAASAAAMFGVAYLSEGSLLQVDSFWPTAVIAALVFAVVNAVIKPIISVLSFPITLLTLGLFTLVINAAMLYLVALIVPGFSTVGFLQTVLAALIITIISSIASSLLDRK